MKVVSKKLLAMILSVMLVISMTPAMAFAEGEKTLDVSWDDCIIIGQMEDYECDILLYDKEVPAGIEQIVFTDEAGNMEGDFSFITTWEMGPAFVYKSNTISVTDDYLIENADLHENEAFTLNEEYEEVEFEDCYGFLIMDDEDETFFVLIQISEISEISLPDITFTASVDGVAVPDDRIIQQPEGYSYIPYGKTEADSYELKTIIIPEGADQVDLKFSDKCIAYNYLGKGSEPVLVDDNDYNSFIGDFYSDPSGITEFQAKVDRNQDGWIDAVQIQAPFSSDWMSGGEILYGITFRYDLFNAFVDGQAMSKVVKTEDGYTPYGYDWTTWEQVEELPVALYTVTVPEGTESVELEFPEESLAYNYTADGKTFLAGEYDNDGQTGVKKVSVAVDADGDGEADCIQVQTPYAGIDSTVLYAVTFDGMSLEKPDPAEVTESDAEELLHNIAAAYAESGAAGQSQAPWIAADMMAYEKAFPDKANKLSDAQKQSMVDEAIAALEKENLTVGDASKYVLALVAMGYDPAQLTTSAGESLDGRARLDALAFNEEGKVSEAAAGAYTLPYVILAYRQFNDTSDQLGLLKEKAVEIKDAWMDTTWGVDGMTPMMLALAPLYNADEAAGAALDKAVAAVRGAQVRSGSIGTYANPSTDGLAAVGFAALGIDPASVTYLSQPDSHSLLAGLVSQANDSKDGFGNDFYTEQGFRGLIASSQAAGGKKYEIYDFSKQELKPAAASKGNVTFRIVPENATVTVKNAEGTEIQPAEEMLYDLPEGTYEYTASCSGYKDKSGSVTVTAEDISGHKKQTVGVSLAKNSSPDSDTVNVTVQVLVHDGDTCNNSVTYKKQPEKYSSLLKEDSYTAKLVKGEGTARDALVEALDDSGITYEEVSNGYFPTIGEYTEFGHGSNSGWLYLVNDKAGTTAMKDVTFAKDGTLTLFYTDDYSKDYGSENWGGDPGGNSDEPVDDPDEPTTDPDSGYYDDTKGHWAEDTINQMTDKGLMKGTADRTFAPDVTLSRAMFVTMLWRLDGEPAVGADEGTGKQFKDVEEDSWYEDAVTWGVWNHIVNGTTDTTFSPNDSLTREQMATFLYRYTEYKGGSMSAPMIPADLFDDLDQISDYAGDSMPWAIAGGLINGVSEKKLAPQGTATRAQAATILLRYIDKHSL